MSELPVHAPLPDRRSRPAVAVLVDAENFSPRFVRHVVAAAEALGSANVRRAFANYAVNGSNWRDGPCAAHGITPVHVPATSVGKNASDIALAIAAMDIAHTRQADIVCIASSDGDFTFLAHRLREMGLSVVGFGSRKAPRAWTDACDRYDVLEADDLSAATADPAPAATGGYLWAGEDTAPVLAVVEEYMAGSARKSLSPVSLLLRTAIAGFDPRRYNKSRLKELVASLPGFEIATGASGDPADLWIARVRPAGSSLRERALSGGRTPRAQVAKRVDLTEGRAFGDAWANDDTAPVLAVVDSLLCKMDTCLLNEAGMALKGEIADFDTRRYGYRKLKDLVGSLPGIEVGLGPKEARNVLVVRRREDEDAAAPAVEDGRAALPEASEDGAWQDPDAPIRAALRKDAVAAIAAVRASDPGILDSALWATVRQSLGITLSDVGATSIRALLESIDAEAADRTDAPTGEARTDDISGAAEPAAPTDTRTTYQVIRSVLNRSTVDAITKAVDAFVGDQPTAELSQVGHALRAAIPGFDSNILGHAGMRELVHSLDGFEVVPVRGQPGLKIRRAPVATVAPPKPVNLRDMAVVQARKALAVDPGIDPQRLWLKVRAAVPGLKLADTGFDSIRDFLDADETLKRVGRGQETD